MNNKKTAHKSKAFLFNRKVVGSSPTRGAIYKKSFQDLWKLFFVFCPRLLYLKLLGQERSM